MRILRAPLADSTTLLGRVTPSNQITPFSPINDNITQTFQMLTEGPLKKEASVLRSWQSRFFAIPGLQAPELSALERGVRYREFIGKGVDRIFDHIDQGKDRGLIVCPMALRDMTEELFRRLMVSPTSMTDKKVLLVAQGKENMERWRKRLERVFDAPRLVADFEREIWEKNGLVIHLASIQQLSRNDSRSLRKFFREIGIVILDKEHHVRPVVDDPMDSDRSRFIRVLIEGGFLSKDFERTSNPEKFLLGLTETVTEGAGRIYGGEEGLIFSETLPNLLGQGFIKKPEVRVILPKGLSNDLPVHFAWANLSLQERVRHSVDIINAVVTEYGEGKKLPRIVFYGGSREEAVALTESLEQIQCYENQVALMVSGDDALEKRRESDFREFSLGLRKIGIHVETMVEGVDEFQEKPVDAVIFSGAEYSGRLAYALQSVGAHLTSQEKVPVIIDQAGMFMRHPDLVYFDPRTYILDEGRFRKGGSLPKRDCFVGKNGGAALEDDDILIIDIFAPEAGKRLAQYLQSISQRPPRALLAMQLGWREELIDQLWQGTFLSHSRQMIETLAESLKLLEDQKTQLIDAWVKDRIRHYEERYPVPEELPVAEKMVLRAVRFGMVLHFGGNIRAVAGIGEKVLREYLKQGLIPKNKAHRLPFLSVIATVIYGTHHKDRGEEFLANHFGISLEELRGFTKKTHVSLRRDLLEISIHKALEELKPRLENAKKGEGKPVRVREIAVRAHLAYCESLSPTEGKPSQRAIEVLLMGKTADPRLVQKIEAAGIDKMRLAEIDHQKAKEIFLMVLEEMRPLSDERRVADNPVRIAEVARGWHQKYCDSLRPEELQPTIGPFQNLLIGKKAVPEFLQLLNSAGIEKMEYAFINDVKLEEVFTKVIEDLKLKFNERTKHKKKLTSLKEVARQIQRNYIELLKPGEACPTIETFYNRLIREMADPEMLHLLETIGIELQDRVRLDNVKAREAFVKAIEDLKKDLVQTN